MVVLSSWFVVMALLSLFLRNTSTISKHGVLPDGVSCWRVCWKCLWKRLKLLGNYFFKKNTARENTSGRKEAVWKELPWDTSVTVDFWLFMSDVSRFSMMMLSCSKVISYQKDHIVLSGHILMIMWLNSSSRH